MNAIGVLLLTAATSTGGLFGKPHVGGNMLTRGGVVADGPAPPGGPMMGAGAPGGPGAPGAGGQPGRRFPNVRSQVFFVDPPGMHIGWQTATGAAGPNGPEKVYLPAQLTVPARYNFTQGYIYRLKLTDIPGRPGLQLYPTIEVAPSTPATDAYLTHNPVPAIFTEEDFDNIVAGNFVTKVIYLPDPKYQELAVSGVQTLVSTRLEPGVDPIVEADRRGTILMIVRIGAIDLEMPANGVSLPTSAVTPLQPGTLSPVPSVTPQPNMGGSLLNPKPAAPVPPVPVDVTPAPTNTPPPAPATPPAEAPKPNDMPAEPAAPPAEAPKPADTPKPPETPLGSLDAPKNPGL